MKAIKLTLKRWLTLYGKSYMMLNDISFQNLTVFI